MFCVKWMRALRHRSWEGNFSRCCRSSSVCATHCCVCTESVETCAPVCTRAVAAKLPAPPPMAVVSALTHFMRLSSSLFVFAFFAALCSLPRPLLARMESRNAICLAFNPYRKGAPAAISRKSAKATAAFASSFSAACSWTFSKTKSSFSTSMRKVRVSSRASAGIFRMLKRIFQWSRSNGSPVMFFSAGTEAPRRCTCWDRRCVTLSRGMSLSLVSQLVARSDSV
mmetsp:Transcript_28481/g.75395  ORF Transcript_28481/g.75395 Transcript_28481/m.75395 type:complete len:226 (+) Transcript_28481:821-1498(+)